MQKTKKLNKLKNLFSSKHSRQKMLSNENCAKDRVSVIILEKKSGNIKNVKKNTEIYGLLARKCSIGTIIKY